MHSLELIQQLQEHFSREEQTVALCCLKQEPLVWNTLHDETFLQTAFELLGQEILNWSTSRIMQVALIHEGYLFQIYEDNEVPISQDVAFRINERYIQLQESAEIPQTLCDAAIFAFELKNNGWPGNNWGEVLSKIVNNSGQLDRDDLQKWRAVLAGLFGLISENEYLIESIESLTPSNLSQQLITHILLSQPFTLENQIKSFINRISKLESLEQTAWILELNRLGRKKLAERLVTRLDSSSGFAYNEGSLRNASFSSRKPLALHILAQEEHAIRNRIIGNQAVSSSLLLSIKSNLEFWLNDIDNYIGENALAEEKGKSAELAGTEFRIEEIRNPNICEVNAGSTNITNIFNRNESNEGKEIKFIEKIQNYFAGSLDYENTESDFQKVIEQFSMQIDITSTEWIPSGKIEWSPEDLFAATNPNGAVKEISILADLIAQNRPSDITSLEKIWEFQSGIGNTKSAHCHLLELTSLDPTNLKWHRELAKRLEEVGDEKGALKEHQFICESTGFMENSDILVFAVSSIKNNDYKIANDLVTRISDQAEEHGSALSIIGRIQSLSGELTEADKYFEKALEIDCHFIKGWIWYAENQRISGNTEKAIQLLKNAIQNNPGSMTLLVELGSTFVLNEDLDTANMCFMEAARIQPDKISDTTTLVGKLIELGNNDLALNVIQCAQRKWIFHPELAYQEAKVLNSLGRKDESILSLEKALFVDDSDLRIHMDYVNLQTGDAENFLFGEEDFHFDKQTKIERSLKYILKADPKNLEASWLNAIIELKSGNIVEALETLKLLGRMLDFPVNEKWKVMAGIGMAAIASGDLETAQIVLSEAEKENPDSIGVTKLLAESQAEAGNLANAKIAASKILQIDPNDIRNLLWFVGLMLKMGFTEEAILVLESNSFITINRSDIMMKFVEYSYALEKEDYALHGIQNLIQLNSPDKDDLLAGARFARKMGEFALASSCIAKIISADDGQDFSLHLALAGINSQTDDFENALISLRTCETIFVDNPILLLLEAEVLKQLGKNQEFQRIMEKAYLGIKNNPEVGSLGKLVFSVMDLLPSRWQNIITDPIEAEILFCKNLLSLGQLHAAVDISDRFDEQFPMNLVSRYLAASLNLSMLNFEKACQIIDAVQDNETVFSGQPSKIIEEMKVLGIEINILTDQINAALNLAERAAIQNSTTFNGEVCKISILAKSGDIGMALMNLTNLSGNLSMNEEWRIGGSEEREQDYKGVMNFVNHSTHWLCMANLACREWESAYTVIYDASQKGVVFPLTWFLIIKCISEANVFAHLYNELGCTHHLPGGILLGHRGRDIIQNAFSCAGSFNSHPNLIKFYQRAELITEGERSQNVEDMDQMTFPDALEYVTRLRNEKNISEAIMFSQRFPDEIEMVFQHALCLLETDPTAGSLLARKVLSQKPEDPLALFLAAKYAEHFGDFEEACKLVENALTIWPQEAEWHATAARLTGELKNSHDEIDHWEMAVKFAPEVDKFSICLGDAYLKAKQADKAIAIFDKYIEEPGTALKMADAYYQLEDLQKAKSIILKAWDVFPEDESIGLLASKIIEAEGDIEKAMAFAQKVFQTNPDSHKAFIQLCKLITKTDGAASALNLFEQYQASGHYSIEISLERANLLSHVHGPGAALSVLTQLADQNPESSIIFAELAKTQARLGLDIDSEKNANRSLRIDGNQPDLYQLLGGMHKKAGQLDKAIKVYSEAIRLNPDILPVYLELGQAYVDRREYSQAVWTFEQAIKIAPDDPRAYYQAGLILRENKDYIGAEKMLRKSSELAPDDIQISRQLGAIITLNLVHRSQEAGICS